MLALRILRGAARGTLTALPTLTQPLFGAPPVNDRGAALDPQVHLMLRLLDASKRPSFDELGPARARVEMDRLPLLSDLAPVPLHRVEDQMIPGPAGEIPIRVYVPEPGAARRPAVVYFHGGGFVIGSLDSHDALCRFYAHRTGATVIAVDYRLAPEHPFPAAVDDTLAAFRWIRDRAAAFHLDPERIAVAGDSAGGDLAAVVCQALRDAGERGPCFQLLTYPATDLSRSCESHRTFAEGFYLTEAMMDWFVANYLTDPSEEKHPRASPLVTAELSGLPPAHVTVAGFDPLRDEGEAYAEALGAAGVPTTLRSYETLIHGFVNMGGLIEAARHAIEDQADVLRARLR
jgi:acetyl esterase